MIALANNDPAGRTADRPDMALVSCVMGLVAASPQSRTFESALGLVKHARKGQTGDGLWDAYVIWKASPEGAAVKDDALEEMRRRSKIDRDLQTSEQGVPMTNPTQDALRLIEDRANMKGKTLKALEDERDKASKALAARTREIAEEQMIGLWDARKYLDKAEPALAARYALAESAVKSFQAGDIREA